MFREFVVLPRPNLRQIRLRSSCSRAVKGLIVLTMALTWPGITRAICSPPLRREVNANEAAVIALAHAPDPALFFEIVDYERHVSARSQKLLGDFVLAERAEMVQDLKSSKLAYG